MDNSLSLYDRAIFDQSKLLLEEYKERKAATPQEHMIQCEEEADLLQRYVVFSVLSLVEKRKLDNLTFADFCIYKIMINKDMTDDLKRKYIQYIDQLQERIHG